MKLVHTFASLLALRLGAMLTSACLVLAACGGGADAPPPPDGGVAPTISQQPADVSVSAGQPASFSVVATGDTPLAYQWQRGGADIAGATAATYTLAAAAAGDNGAVFRVVVGNGTGNATSSAATLTVTASATAPTISSFTATPATLPIGGGSVTLNWASSGATTLSIDNGVGDVTGLTSKAVNVAANTTFTLTASNAVGSASAATTVSLAAAADRFVDPVNGDDANPCTAAAPCRSIGKALTNAAAGSTLALADGVYTPAPNSGFSVGVPDGVTLRATNPGAATIANMDLFLHGSATIDGLVVDRSGPINTNTCGVITAQGNATTSTTLTLIGVFSNCPQWLGLGPNVKATLTPGSLPGGVYTTGLPAGNQQFALVGNGAELLIQGGTLDGGNVVTTLSVGVVMNVLAGGKLTLDGVTFKNYVATAIDSSGQTILTNGTTLDHVGIPGDPGPQSGGFNQCAADSAIVARGGSSLTLDHATLSNVASAGICVGAVFAGTATTSIQITQSTVAHVAGAAIETYWDAGIGQIPPAALGPTVNIDSTTFTDTGRALFWYRIPGAAITLSNVTVTASTAAANTGDPTANCPVAAIRLDTVDGPMTFKMRNSTLSNNAAQGLCVEGQVPAADLGTTGDPGGNTFTGNATTGLTFIVSNTVTPQTMNAVGNTWAANQQGADANGHYSVAPGYVPVLKAGPATGVNFTIGNVLGSVNF
jgi:hypothetical protein